MCIIRTAREASRHVCAAHIKCRSIASNVIHICKLPKRVRKADVAYLISSCRPVYFQVHARERSRLSTVTVLLTLVHVSRRQLSGLQWRSSNLARFDMANAPCARIHAHVFPSLTTAGQALQLPALRHRTNTAAALWPQQRCSQLQQAQFCMLHAGGIGSRPAGNRPLPAPSQRAAPRWSRNRDRCPQPDNTQSCDFQMALLTCTVCIHRQPAIRSLTLPRV